MAKDDKVLMDRLTTVMKKKPAPKPEPKDVQSESSKMQQAEEEKQRKVDLEYENYMKNDKTRLKDQGGSMFAKGGVLDELERGVRRVGQDLNIAEDPNKYGKTKLGEKIANSDFAKGVRNYVRLQKEGMGMRAKNDEFEKKKGGMIKSASSRADGCAIRGKTRA
jgi:hypothetical protein